MFTLIQAGISCKWANDSQCFLLEYFDTIHDSPSQIYHSALPFCPPSSWLHKCYSLELSQEVEVVKGLPAEWGMCFWTIELDNVPLALAHWKNTIVISSESRGIIIIDGVTGIQTAIFSGHTDWVLSLTFSQDGTSLASGSCDKTIKLWDVQTGGVITTFHGHTGVVHSVSISADCTMITSGSSDKTVRLWVIQTEECHCIIEQQEPVYHVVFSSTDPQYLISVSGRKVWQWNINGHQINATQNGHPINHSHNGINIAFSLDGAQFALCHGENIVVRNSDSQVIMTKIHVASGEPNCCCFSPDGRYIAAAVGSIAYIWETTSSDSHPIQTFIGHGGKISSLGFSSSLISLSDEGSAKFWHVGALPINMIVTDLEPTPHTAAEILSVTLQTMALLSQVIRMG